MLLHIDALTHRHFYTQTLLTKTLLHTNAFTHKRFYTQSLLHTDAFTHRRFYTQSGPCSRSHSEVIVVAATSAMRRRGEVRTMYLVDMYLDASSPLLWRTAQSKTSHCNRLATLPWLETWVKKLTYKPVSQDWSWATLPVVIPVLTSIKICISLKESTTFQAPCSIHPRACNHRQIADTIRGHRTFLEKTYD